MRLILVAGAIFNLSFLVACRYLEFFGGLISALLCGVGAGGGLSLTNLAAPTGISFYTLMAVSYLVDVYRGTVRADRNLGHVALFLGFFPLVIEGPFCRFGEVMPGYVAEGKTSLSIAVGCTGGQHRSVVIANATAAYLIDRGYQVTLSHRDLPKAVRS